MFSESLSSITCFGSVRNFWRRVGVAGSKRFQVGDCETRFEFNTKLEEKRQPTRYQLDTSMVCLETTDIL